MLNKRYLVIRLDIDTPLCIKKGVPKLIELAKDQDVHFTFFVNMGQSVSRIEAIKNLAFSQRGNSFEISKLSNIKKLGCFGYFSVAILNKQVGLGYPEMLKNLVLADHEVGLHGGKNHSLWQNFAQKWSFQELSDQVNWGIKSFYSVLGFMPTLFSSPGWNSPGLLVDILAQHGFIGIADSYLNSDDCITLKNSIQNINTNLVGRPGGVGFFESCKSKGLSDLEILEKVKEALNCRNINVIYDHPYYLANNYYTVLQQIIKYAKESKIEIITMGQLLKEND